MTDPRTGTTTTPAWRLGYIPFAGGDEHPAAYFYANSITAETRESYDYEFKRFDEWCRTYGVSSVPTDPMHVLCFLHQHRAMWGWHRMYRVVDAIQHRHLDEGAPEIKTDLVRRYLSTRKREVGKYAEGKQVDAIETEHARTMVRFLRADLSAEVVLARLAIAVAYATGIDCVAAVLEHLSVGVVTVRTAEKSCRITIKGRRGVLDSSTPGALSAVTGLGSSGFAFDEAHRAQLVASVDDAWERAGLSGERRHGISRLSAQDLEWLIANVDPDHDERTLYSAYLLVGHALARRHAELAGLNLKHLTKRAGGWQVLIARSKTDQEGQGEVLPLDHEFDAGDGCDLVCGACAAERLLEVHQRRFGRTLQDSSPMFPAEIYTAERWSTRAARRLLKRWWLDAGLNPSARIGTRSIRVGTVTSLSRRGASIEEISRVTLHVTRSWVLRYLRHHDPQNWQVFLPL